MLLLAEPKSPYNSQVTQQQWIEVLVDCPWDNNQKLSKNEDETEDQDTEVLEQLSLFPTPFSPTTSARESSGWDQRLFTYRVPPDLSVKPGDILSVPFGPSVIGGIAIRYISSPPVGLDPSRIKDVEDVITSGFFPGYYWQLINRVAQYYYTELIKVVKIALPPGLLGRSQYRLKLKTEIIPQGAEVFLSPIASQVLKLLQSQKDGDYTAEYIRRKIRGANRGIRELLKRGWIESYFLHPKPTQAKQQKTVTLVVDNILPDLTPLQREVLEVLKYQGGEMWQSELMKLCDTSASTLESLQKKGCIVIEQREILRLLQHPEMDRDYAKYLTSAQTNALEVINNLTGFAQVLLHGITGSGKTEVYLQAIAPILAQGKSALVLVPEIGLTPQLTDRFRARFGHRVCVYHSALSTGERYDTWRQMITGDPQVVIGTRSAVFAPLPKLGLIILDEEHDHSFKQVSPAPTYHAGTVAKWRAELEDCPLILGSATPSLETWVKSQQTESINQHYLSLPERIQSRPLPPVEIVDMRQELQQGNRSIFSRPLERAILNLLEQKKQGILFINRRGHSTFVSCRSCGYVIECPHCDVSLSYHYTNEESTELLRCHYCNHSQYHPRTCPECDSPYLKFFGTGTQKVTQELTRQFPQLRWIRFDSDTTSKKGSHRELLSQFARGEADLLVGTQMLTKGLDIAQVTLVGVVAADGLLYHSDYRASERAFQTLTQVAGRAGRGDEPGKVIIQSYSPENPVIQAVREHNYHQFIERELPERESLNYPPYGRLILLRLSGIDGVQVQQAAEILADACADKMGSTGEILGPAPASIMRIARRYRWQILLKFSEDMTENMPDLTGLRSLCPPSVSMTIDVDPLGMD